MGDILILGDGLLGSEIRKQTGWDYISRKKDGIDFTYLSTYEKYLIDYDQIVNCIGFTDTYNANRYKSWNVNYKGVCDLVDSCWFYEKKLVHISTDYIYANSDGNATEESIPVHAKNWYSYCKLLADGYVQLRASNYLLIRTSFKPNPFPYPDAIIQWGNFDYVDKIASLIIQLITKNASGVFNVGTEVKSMGELARKTNNNIGYTDKKLHKSMPMDITMNVEKMEKFLSD